MGFEMDKYILIMLLFVALASAVAIIVSSTPTNRYFILTNIEETRYLEYLSEIAPVIYVENEVVSKILASSARLYINVSSLPSGVVLVELLDARVSGDGSITAIVKPRTICLGFTTPKCLTNLYTERPIVLFVSEEIGIVKDSAIEMPELADSILDENTKMLAYIRHYTIIPSILLLSAAVIIALILLRTKNR